MVWFSNANLNTGQPNNHLDIVQMDTILFAYVLVQYLNGRSSYSSTGVAKTLPRAKNARQDFLLYPPNFLKISVIKLYYESYNI